MQEPDFAGIELETATVAIWGLGLMGGSLAMALRGKCARLVGIDSDPATVALAKARKVVDDAYDDPRLALEGAHLIILAVPVRAILAIMENLPRLHSRPAVVMDLGSTKADILAGMARLPQGWEAVGGHPMCGKEKSSLEYAELGLYQGAVFALTVLAKTGAHARKFAEDLVEAVGSTAVWVTAEEHDRWVAATSHLPFLLSSALAGSTPEAAAQLAGPGFRGATRLAASSPEMMVDILATNRANVRHALKDFRTQLDLYDRLLAEGDYAALAEQFGRAADHLRLFGPRTGVE